MIIKFSTKKNANEITIIKDNIDYHLALFINDLIIKEKFHEYKKAYF